MDIGDPDETPVSISDPRRNRVAPTRIDLYRIIVEREGEGHLSALGGNLNLSDHRRGDVHEAYVANSDDKAGIGRQGDPFPVNRRARQRDTVAWRGLNACGLFP